jgi:sec-independent protein translocase protein TatA
MIPKVGPVELVLILVIVTMLFGVGKLPEVFGSVGRGIREFRRNSADPEDEVKQTTTVETTTPVAVAPVAPVVVEPAEKQTVN